MELTGELGDGWFPWVNTPETYSKCIESISAGARKAGRRPEEIDAATWFYSTISEDLKVQAGAVEAGKSILFLEKTILRSTGFEVTYPHYQHLLATHPFKTYAELRRAAREVPEKPVQETLMIGGPDECIEFIERFIHVGARHICFRIMSFPGSPSIEDTLKTLSQKIIPHLKENR